MKVATRDPDAIAVYLDEPQTVGFGLIGGYRFRNIKVLVDQGYRFDQTRMEIADQLYPFDTNAAFTSHGEWMYSPGVRSYTGYELVNGKVVVFPDVQIRARKQYDLSKDDEFLGLVGGDVFYWKPSDKSSVHWRTRSSREDHVIVLPKSVVDIYGVTKGIRGDVGVVLLQRASGFIVKAPNETRFLDITLATGKIN